MFALSADAVYSEHVLEHLPFSGAVGFIREAGRILRPGGIFRVVCPMLDRILHTTFDDEGGQATLANVLDHLRREDPGLAESAPLIRAFPQPFFLNALFRGHGHRFIWSSELLLEVLRSAGFSAPRICAIGEGRDPEHCLERRRRGVYLGNDWQEDRASGEIYDPESVIVEAER